MVPGSAWRAEGIRSVSCGLGFRLEDLCSCPTGRRACLSVIAMSSRSISRECRASRSSSPRPRPSSVHRRALWLSLESARTATAAPPSACTPPKENVVEYISVCSRACVWRAWCACAGGGIVGRTESQFEREGGREEIERGRGRTRVRERERERGREGEGEGARGREGEGERKRERGRGGGGGRGSRKRARARARAGERATCSLPGSGAGTTRLRTSSSGSSAMLTCHRRNVGVT
jgi:hypothetical protein